MKKLYCVICGRYRNFEKKKKKKKKKSILSIICRKCKNEEEKIFKKEELIEILKILCLIENIQF